MSSRSSRGVPAEIHATPLIDVLLVLLIIFIVSVPILTRLHPGEVPPKDLGAVPDKPPVIVKLRADATASIDDGPSIMAVELARALRPRVRAGAHVFVDFEDGVPWGDVVGTVDTVRSFANDPASIQVAVTLRDTATE